MTPFSVELSPNARSAGERDAILADPGFGRHFTDHMVSIRFDRERGWYEPSVVPYGPITLDPATNFIHYGQSIFEGMKAYKHTDGHIRTFRPHKNAHRFRASARRLAMPEIPAELFIQSLVELAHVDGGWVPSDPEKSLYLRPFMFSTEVGLGVKPADEYQYLLIASPAGAYFPRGVAPSLCVADPRLRAGGRGWHGRGQMCRQLRGILDRPGRGVAARLRSGRLARRQGTPVGRGDGGYEPLLRLRHR
jgi:branched-chain amino acid aminotransferase